MPTAKPVRLMCWNILEGLHLPLQPGGMPELDRERFDAAKALIDEIGPDVLVLNEALWCRPFEGHFVDYAKLFAFAYSHSDNYDEAWGNTILSHIPFASTHRFRIHNRGGIRASLIQEDWKLTVATYHPHPGRYPVNKASDYAAMVPCDLDHPFVVCGDFNAISPADAIDEVELAAAFARFSKNPAADLARFTEGGRNVFAKLEELGLRDALEGAGRRYSMPTDLLSSDKSSAMRIDHAWVNAHTQVLKGEVLHHPCADVASDHYPVVVEVGPLPV